MAPPTYSKKKMPELEDLLIARGLPTGGTKIQMVSRLVTQDHANELERKATEAGVQAASTQARATGDENQQPPQNSAAPASKTARRRPGKAPRNADLNRGEAQDAGKTLRGQAGGLGPRRRNNAAAVKAKREDGSHVLRELSHEARESYVKSLASGSNTANRDGGVVNGSEGKGAYPEIMVKMTPAPRKSMCSMQRTTRQADANGPENQNENEAPPTHGEKGENSSNARTGPTPRHGDSGYDVIFSPTASMCFYLVLIILALALFALVIILVYGTETAWRGHLYFQRVLEQRALARLAERALEAVERVREAVQG
ncbi:hypothetical protein P280DRAFT_192560 [Massarina eburnea CBS 473.64]|uniref:SAP domain-containing protein n=1 Tax=Massarina eburnea CBS 473.64 TaxID=1395130 RepID=A0A6A6RM97_9PLEO|nr:hypothetical protein P280DRAFT_192560 [Massarina eburnea CBS 473.64]